MASSVRVRGREVVVLDKAAMEELPRVTQDVTVNCESGPEHESTWVGIPLEAVVETAGAPPETTHLAVTGADDCLVYVALEDALNGILALERDGTPLENPRLVASRIEARRNMKDVVEIEAVTLAPDTDPEDLERHPKIDRTAET